MTMLRVALTLALIDGLTTATRAQRIVRERRHP